MRHCDTPWGMGECEPWGLCDLPQDLTLEGRRASQGVGEYGQYENPIYPHDGGWRSPGGMGQVPGGTNRLFGILAVIGVLWLLSSLFRSS